MLGLASRRIFLWPEYRKHFQLLKRRDNGCIVQFCTIELLIVFFFSNCLYLLYTFNSNSACYTLVKKWIPRNVWGNAMRTYEQFVHTLDKDRADDRICESVCRGWNQACWVISILHSGCTRTTAILQRQPLEGKPTCYSGCTCHSRCGCVPPVLRWGSKELPSWVLVEPYNVANVALTVFMHILIFSYSCALAPKWIPKVASSLDIVMQCSKSPRDLGQPLIMEILAPILLWIFALFPMFCFPLC